MWWRGLHKLPGFGKLRTFFEDITVEELRISASIIDAADPALEVASLIRLGGYTEAAIRRIERVLGNPGEAPESVLL